MEDRLFMESDKRSENIDRKLCAFIKEDKISEAEAFIKEAGLTLRLIPYQLMNVISCFNSNLRDEKDCLKQLKAMKKFGLAKAKVEDDILRLKFLGTKSSAYPINKVINNAEEFFDWDKRQGECHDLCLRLAVNLQNECSVLTGFLHGMTEQSKYLHSVVKVQVGKYPRIIDTTMNAMLTEEFYKKITGFEVITEIPSSVIKDDVRLMKSIGETNLDLKDYFLYRDECISKIQEKYCHQNEVEKPIEKGK